MYKNHVLSIILRQHLPMVIKSYCFHEHQLTPGQLTGHFVHSSIDPRSYPCDHFLAEGELETWGDSIAGYRAELGLEAASYRRSCPLLPELCRLSSASSLLAA